MPKPLSDHQVYDLLYDAERTLMKKRGASDFGDGALEAARVALHSIAESLVYREVDAPLEVEPTDFVNVRVRMPRQAHENLVRFSEECTNVSSQAEAVCFILGYFFRQLGYPVKD